MTDLQNILFLDIETVPQYATLDDAPETYRTLWSEKAANLARDEEDTPESLFERAGIYAEFGRIVCISVGHLNERNGQRELRIKSYYGHDEEELLEDFANLLNQHFNTDQHYLCGHNGKEFDFPYIARRMLIHRIPLPRLLNVAGSKPWEVRHLDTMLLWKFGDFKNFTSLKVLAHVFNLPTPKEDIDGSQVYGVYWEDKDVNRITRYCQKDVVTLVQVYLALTQQATLQEKEINEPTIG